MIPKIIHYCWFGRNEKSEEITQCIQTWMDFFPDWEIIEWNEDNYDVNKNAYTSEAYRLKKWAFVSDVARLEVLHKYGGIYLDVDVEFIKEIPCSFFIDKGFCGFENDKYIAPGLVFAIEKENSFIEEVLNTYNNEVFEIKKDGIYRTINVRVTEIMVKKGLILNNTKQTIEGISVYPSNVFCGYDTDIHEPNITDSTICWHHYTGSWSNKSLKTILLNSLKKVIGTHFYKKLLLLKRRISDGIN